MNQAVRSISLDELANTFLKKEMKKAEQDEGDNSNLVCAIRTARDELKHIADTIKKIQKDIEDQEPVNYILLVILMIILTIKVQF
jgi:hypothetical protein